MRLCHACSPPGAEDVALCGGDDQVCVVAGEPLMHESALGDLRVFLHVVVLGPGSIERKRVEEG